MNQHRGSKFDPAEFGIPPYRIDAPLAFHLAQLRHAYSHLMAERVKDQRQFADGLIAPAIEAIEEHIGKTDAP
jgi:hypothetical protein